MRGLIAIAASFLLAGCSSPEMAPGTSRFCKEEKRVIPDTELKVRLLLDMLKKGRRLPEMMTRHAANFAGTLEHNAAWSRGLADFVGRNPLCCQLVTRDLLYPRQNYFDTRFHNADDDSFYQGAFSAGYFANFYVQYKKPFLKVSKLKTDESGKRFYRDQIAWIAAFNCGKTDDLEWYIHG